MKDYSELTKDLSPEQQKLFDLYMKEKNITIRETNDYTIEPITDGREYYCMSSAQKRIYMISRMEPDNTLYNMPMAMDIEGKLNVEKLREVFKTVVKRHESFRTSFHMIENEPMQKINNDMDFSMEVIKETDEVKAQKIREAFIKSFDLSMAPLLRVKLIEKSKNSHCLLVDMHHIISDGMSIGVLFREIASLYKGEKLDTPRIQYKDFAVWQNKYLSSDVMKEQEKYWLDTFRGDIPVLDMATDYQRPAMQSFVGDRLEFQSDHKIYTGLKSIVAKTGTTMYMVLLAAYNILLSKYSSQEDIIVGSPIAGRSYKDVQTVIGMFVNTLAMRNQPKKELTFKEFLYQVKENALKAYDNQEYQFEELVEKIEVTRTLNRNPIFDTMFVLQNIDIREIDIEGLKFKLSELDFKIAKFDLMMNAVENREEIDFNIEYCSELYKKETIARMSKHFLNILSQIVNNMDIVIADIELITEKEKKKILIDFNDTKSVYPSKKTIQEIFGEQVKLHKDNIALVYRDCKLTYGELNERANRLAWLLHKKKVGKDSIVGIITERSIEMVVSILAVLKAGGVYLPIDPAYPKERIEFMLKDCNTQVLVVATKCEQMITFMGEIIDIANEETKQYSSEDIRVDQSADDLAYIMYTSGSTGKPKGVMVKHRNVVRLVKNTNYIKFNDGDRILQTGAPVFDATTFELWGALLNGLSLYLIDKDVILDVNKLGDSIRENHITIMWLTSPLFNQLCQQDSSIFAPLHYLLVGGDVLSPKHIDKVRKENKNLRIINGYGPTENTTFSACKLITKKYSGSIPIGKPIGNSTIYILDKDKKVLPIGVPGEIYLGGDGLAKGYINDSFLTEQKFIENPFVEGEKIYKTGDVGRWLTNGDIEFRGRIDNQTKFRGYRIELGEIETCLVKHTAIKEAVVVVKEDENENKFLCAYVVMTDKKSESTQEIKEYLKQALPDYMIPQHFVYIEKLPLNQNGKIDKKALPDVTGEVVSTIEYVEPRNEIEKKLVDIWKEVLGIDKIGIDDDFFELGGHSLRATILVSKMQRELGINIKIKEVFRNSTIRKISEFISKAEKKNDTVIQPAATKEYYPLTASQKRIYVISQVDADGILYNMPCSMEIEGNLDVDKLNDVFQKIVSRHESFRTSFDIIDGEYVQRIHKQVNFAIDYIKESKEEKLKEINKTFVKPFDLRKAPLMRVQLVETKSSRYYLNIDIHHIIGDGMSMDILFREIESLYKGKKLEDNKIQYKDFAVWQSESKQITERKKQENYWLNMFRGEIPVLDIATDYQRPAIQSYEGDRITFSAGEEIAKGLNQLASRTNTTMYMILLAAYNVLLSKYSGQEDIIVGSPIAGRTSVDVKNMIGMFVNTLAMRNQPKKDLPFIEFLNLVKENALKAYDNQEYPFEELVQNVNVPRDISRNPLFDTMFAMQNMRMSTIDIEGLKFNIRKLEYKVAKFDLVMNAVEYDSNLNFTLEYCMDLFKKETIERMAMHFLMILKQIIQDHNIVLSDIEIVTKEEKEMIIHEFNLTKKDWKKDKTIHKLFEEQVRKHSDKIALVYKEDVLTYGQLNAMANALAWLLRDNKIGPCSIVGIMTERSIEMIISIIAVLKAGGAYLPIDPTYPKDRITYMLKNSDINLLLSTKEYSKNVAYDKVSINLNDSRIYEGKKNNLDYNGYATDLAYIIYTSGSTGRPKGVMVEHSGIVNLKGFFENEYHITQNDRILQFASCSFDASVWEIFMALLSGASLHIVQKEIINNPKEFETFMNEQAITVATLPPNYLENLEPDHINSLTRIITAGSATSSKLVKAWNKKRIYVNAYGPTETTICATSYSNQPSDEYRVIPIGKPIYNTRVYILDKNGRIAPIGVVGELCISGVGLAKGYQNEPILTKEKFIMNPYESGERMYRTGDLAKWLPDGNIEFCGRMDNQVKIRGFRIELEEIKNQLEKYKQIKEVVVVARDDKEGNKYLCGYIVSDNELSLQELRTHLLQTLPDYMIPQHFVRLDKLPTNQSGKVDVKALKELTVDILMQNEYVAPRNEVEKVLASTWEEVLGVEKVGIYDSFFELGGDSIKAMRVVAKMSVNYRINVKDMFEQQNIEQLAKKVTKQQIIKKIKEMALAERKVVMNEVAATEENVVTNTKNEAVSQISSYQENMKRYDNMDIKKTKEYENILLFGSTGYLGIYIVNELLKHTESNLYLLIRSDSVSICEERLKNTFKFYFTEELYYKYKDRLTVIHGDISKEHLGMEMNEYEQLSEKIDCVINSAANVKHYGKYEEFYKTNVVGINNIISFAQNKRVKDVNQVSTISVSQRKANDEQSIYFTELSGCEGLHSENNYIKTKQEAEAIIEKARNQGINCNIYRVGNLVFDSSTGRFQKNIEDNNFYNTIKSYIKLAAFPKIESITFDFTMIDQASRAIVALMSTNLKNETYHIYNSNQVNMVQLTKMLQKSIPTIQLLDFTEFLTYLEQEYDKGEKGDYIENIVLQYNMSMQKDPTSILTRSDKTNRILNKIGFEWPIVADEHIDKMIRYCKLVKFL